MSSDGLPTVIKLRRGEEMYRFASKYAAFNMVIEASRLIYANDGSGRVVETKPGHSVQFEKHEFLTEDQEIADWIRAQRGFGVDFVEIGEGDVIPHTVAPVEVTGALGTGTVVAGNVRCPLCGRMFRNPQAWKMHYKSHEKEARAAEPSEVKRADDVADPTG